VDIMASINLPARGRKRDPTGHGFSGLTSDFGFETSSCGFCGCGRAGRLAGEVVGVNTCPAGRAGCRGIISGCGAPVRASAAGGAGLS
jgi:hypothetical protein